MSRTRRYVHAVPTRTLGAIALLVIGAAGVSAGCMGISTEPFDGGDPDVGRRDLPIDAPTSPDAERPDAAPRDGSEPGGPEDSGGSDLEVVEPCEKRVAEFFDASEISHPGSGSDDYRPADEGARAHLRRSITRVVQRDLDGALDSAEAAGYTICRGPVDQRRTLVWVPRNRQLGRARMALRVSPEARPLIVEAPHAFFEYDTLAEALAIFVRGRARAVIATGTHRCASSAPSGCDGETGVCGRRGPYRVSDMAHNTETMFQTMHETVTQFDERSVAVSLHGFSDEGISLSNGTTGPAARESPVARLGRALESTLPNERITYCNDIPGESTEERLCGTTNVQGRHLNGVADACTSSASGATGRFLHVEQSRAVRERFPTVADAFADALSE